MIISLTVEPISIVIQPGDISIAEGEDALFTVFVSGDSPSYQWQKDGADISDIADTYSGTNTDSLTVLSAADGVDEGMYRVVVSNAASSSGVMSNAATLTICKLLLFVFVFILYSSIEHSNSYHTNVQPFCCSN